MDILYHIGFFLCKKIHCFKRDIRELGTFSYSAPGQLGELDILLTLHLLSNGDGQYRDFFVVVVIVRLFLVDFLLFLQNLSSTAENITKRLHSTVGALVIRIIVKMGMVLV